MYQQIAQVGGKLAETGIELLAKMKDAEDSVEIDTLVRKERELHVAYLETRRTEQDPEAQKVLFDKYTKDANALRSESNRVDNAYRSRLDKISPDRQNDYNVFVFKLRQKKLLAEHELNSESHLVTGDKKSYAMGEYKAAKSGIITLKEAEWNVDRFDSVSALIRAGRYFSNAKARPAGEEKTALLLQAKTLLKGTDKSKLSDRQLKYRSAMLVDVEKFATEAYGQGRLREIRQAGTDGEVDAIVAEVAKDADANKITEKQAHTIGGLARQQKADFKRNAADAKRVEKERVDKYVDLEEESLIQFDLENPDATIKEVNAFADISEARVMAADIPPDAKFAYKSRINSWRNQSGSIDYERLQSMNMEITATLVSGHPVDSLLRRVKQAYLDRAMGGRSAQAAGIYNTMSNRLRVGRDREAFKQTRHVREAFEASVTVGGKIRKTYTAKKIFMLEQSIHQYIADNPKASTMDVVDFAGQMSATYLRLSRFDTEAEWLQRKSVPASVPIVSTDEEYDAIPSGGLYVDPDGITRRKP